LRSIKFSFINSFDFNVISLIILSTFYCFIFVFFRL
jgi:hypothetical protein